MLRCVEVFLESRLFSPGDLGRLHRLPPRSMTGPLPQDSVLHKKWLTQSTHLDILRPGMILTNSLTLFAANIIEVQAAYGRTKVVHQKDHFMFVYSWARFLAEQV